MSNLSSKEIQAVLEKCELGETKDKKNYKSAIKKLLKEKDNKQNRNNNPE